jgi:CheY-like chemotaxis protein
MPWLCVSEHGKVLIVDDEAAIRSLLAVVARRAGCVVDLAHDGVEAIRLLTLKRYDVLLLDLMMPRVNGYEVIEFLKTRKDRPIVFVVTATANIFFRDFDPDVVRSIVRKPFDVDVIAALIADTALARRDPLDAAATDDPQHDGELPAQVC